MSIPCNINQALALLLQMGFPDEDRKRSGAEIAAFKTPIPLCFFGAAHQLLAFKDSYHDLRKYPPLNGSVRQKWLELMNAPPNCYTLCEQLTLNDLHIIWRISVSQKAPLAILFRQFAR